MHGATIRFTPPQICAYRFAINGGRVTYQSRFLKTQTYKRNMAAQRIVVTEFGTRSVPDPCQTIFQRYCTVLYTHVALKCNSWDKAQVRCCEW